MRTKFRFPLWILVALTLTCAWASDAAFAQPPENAGEAISAPVHQTTAQVSEDTELSCPAGLILGSGPPDPELLSEEASVGIRAFWCERYDAFGNSNRFGPYREVYANGQIRVEATYVQAVQAGELKPDAPTRLEGPIEIRHDDGSPFLRGFLKAGEWAGDLVIFHETGQPWFEGKFEQGQLDGPLRTRHQDGALESETRFSRGREQGLARSFFATAAGGRLKSEVSVERDQIVGAHRLLDPEGELRSEIHREASPSLGLDAVWPVEDTPPVGPTTAPPAAASTSGPQETAAPN